ncbi:MAG: aquaporin [Gemmatimonadota bacterium]|nr:MAG: aquaporin [Gemmatimonadota bacterium]
MISSLKPLVAEFLGTFGLVFVGAGAIVANTWTNNALGLLGIGLATALAYATMVTTTMNISGGHLNPAVTAALWMARRIDAVRAGSYIATQLLAAVIAALLVRLLFPGPAVEVTSLGTPKIAVDVTMPQAIAAEALMTLLLVSSVCGTIVSRGAPKVGGFAVGLVQFCAILVVGPLTGAALNPARAFGPALVSLDFEGHIAYWAGPLLGGLAAGWVWWKTLLSPEDLGPSGS